MKCCVRAGELGNFSCILTSASLYESLRGPLGPRGRGKQPETELSILGSRIWEWLETGEVEMNVRSDMSGACGLKIPEVFCTTPAARYVCRKYPQIRAIVSKDSLRCRISDIVNDIICNCCGWTLLENIQRNREQLQLVVHMEVAHTSPFLVKRF